MTHPSVPEILLYSWLTNRKVINLHRPQRAFRALHVRVSNMRCRDQLSQVVSVLRPAESRY